MNLFSLRSRRTFIRFMATSPSCLWLRGTTTIFPSLMPIRLSSKSWTVGSTRMILSTSIIRWPLGKSWICGTPIATRRRLLGRICTTTLSVFTTRWRCRMTALSSSTFATFCARIRICVLTGRSGPFITRSWRLLGLLTWCTRIRMGRYWFTIGSDARRLSRRTLLGRMRWQIVFDICRIRIFGITLCSWILTRRFWSRSMGRRWLDFVWFVCTPTMTIINWLRCPFWRRRWWICLSIGKRC